mmetsp:Transcript_40383/g.92700  ORF Transcript_40383/g.92700 Transcript_40383/m.92700 type:complete len:215 (-) Transcript_40383:370-1014(-)
MTRRGRTHGRASAHGELDLGPCCIRAALVCGAICYCLNTASGPMRAAAADIYWLLLTPWTLPMLVPWRWYYSTTLGTDYFPGLVNRAVGGGAAAASLRTASPALCTRGMHAHVYCKQLKSCDANVLDLVPVVHNVLRPSWALDPDRIVPVSEQAAECDAGVALRAQPLHIAKLDGTLEHHPTIMSLVVRVGLTDCEVATSACEPGAPASHLLGG